MTATSEQSQRPSWKGWGSEAYPGPGRALNSPQASQAVLAQPPDNEGRTLCLHAPHLIFVSAAWI